jgi:hypothetical protein
MHLGNHIDPFLASLITILEIVSKCVPKSTPLFGKGRGIHSKGRLYKITQSGQHAHPIMSCMDLIHLRIEIYLDNCNWWIHINP